MWKSIAKAIGAGVKFLIKNPEIAQVVVSVVKDQQKGKRARKGPASE